MATAYDDENLPLPLLHRAAPRASCGADEDILSPPADRFRPGSAGAVMGFVAGAAGLGFVHAMHAVRMGEGMSRLATALTIPADAAGPLAYLGAAALGSIVGAGFGRITQHLRRFVPLLFWAIVFFASVATLALALASTYAQGFVVAMAPTVLAASAVFALVTACELPLRRRS